MSKTDKGKKRNAGRVRHYAMRVIGKKAFTASGKLKASALKILKNRAKKSGNVSLERAITEAQNFRKKKMVRVRE